MNPKLTIFRRCIRMVILLCITIVSKVANIFQFKEYRLITKILWIITIKIFHYSLEGNKEIKVCRYIYMFIIVKYYNIL